MSLWTCRCGRISNGTNELSGFFLRPACFLQRTMPQTKNSRCRAKKSPKAGDSAPASSRWAITEVPDGPASMAGPSNGAAECKGQPSEDYRDAVQPAMYGGREGEAPKKSRTGPIWNIGNSEYWSLINQKATIVDKTLLIPDFIESRHYANLVCVPDESPRLRVSLLRLETSKSRIFRCFEIVDIQDPSQARQVLQCQYTVWPDHGAPHCPKEFLDFMDEVRSEAGRCNPG